MDFFSGIIQFFQSLENFFNNANAIVANLREFFAPFSSWLSVHVFGPFIFTLCVVGTILIVVNVVRDIF